MDKVTIYFLNWNVLLNKYAKIIIGGKLLIKQIKSKKRVSTYGEVYTAQREVNAMLDLVNKEASKITTTFLEPACGNGNFLVAILKRKLETVNNQNTNIFKTSINILRAVASIYGVDIQKDNVEETSARIRDLANSFYMDLRCPTGSYYESWMRILDLILETNILCGNTLTATLSDGKDMKFSEWIIFDNGVVVRDEVKFQDMLDGTDDDVMKHSKYHYNVYDFTYRTA